MIKKYFYRKFSNHEKQRKFKLYFKTYYLSCRITHNYKYNIIFNIIGVNIINIILTPKKPYQIFFITNLNGDSMLMLRNKCANQQIYTELKRDYINMDLSSKKPTH